MMMSLEATSPPSLLSFIMVANAVLKVFWAFSSNEAADIPTNVVLDSTLAPVWSATVGLDDDGAEDGAELQGLDDGATEGIKVGTMLGVVEGTLVGWTVGITVGISEGKDDGNVVGKATGMLDGIPVG